MPRFWLAAGILVLGLPHTTQTAQAADTLTIVLDRPAGAVKNFDCTAGTLWEGVATIEPVARVRECVLEPRGLTKLEIRNQVAGGRRYTVECEFFQRKVTVYAEDGILRGCNVKAAILPMRSPSAGANEVIDARCTGPTLFNRDGYVINPVNCDFPGKARRPF